MRKTALLLVVALALTSGIVLSRLWTLYAESPATIPATEDSALEQEVLRFYDGVNKYLETGDEASVRSLLQVDYVGRRPGTTWASTADDLLVTLATVREHFPRLRLRPVIQATMGDWVTVSLGRSGADSFTVAGIRIEDSSFLGQVELVRVSRGKIAERWEWSVFAGEFSTYPTRTLELALVARTIVPTVERWTVGTDLTEPISHPHNLVLIPEKSSVSITLGNTSLGQPQFWSTHQMPEPQPSHIESGTQVTLAPGDAFFVPARTLHRLRVVGDRSATLLVLRIGPAFHGGQSTAPPQEAISVETVTGGTTLPVATERVAISIGRVSIAPGSILPQVQGDGLGLAVSFGGALQLDIAAGQARVDGRNGPYSLATATAQIADGRGASIGPGSLVSYEAIGAEPTSVWFISIVPIADDGVSEPPTPPSMTNPADSSVE